MREKSREFAPSFNVKRGSREAQLWGLSFPIRLIGSFGNFSGFVRVDEVGDVAKRCPPLSVITRPPIVEITGDDFGDDFVGDVDGDVEGDVDGDVVGKLEVEEERCKTPGEVGLMCGFLPRKEFLERERPIEKRK